MTLKIGDAVQVVPGAVYLNNGKDVPESLFNMKLYVRDIKNNICTIARAKAGAILGEVNMEDLVIVEGNVAMIDPYVIMVPSANVPLYHSANKNSGIVKRLNRFALITIVDEKNGFGKVKVGAGWVELTKVNKI